MDGSHKRLVGISNLMQSDIKGNLLVEEVLNACFDYSLMDLDFQPELVEDYSAGIKQFDTNHEQIEAVLGEMVKGMTPAQEQQYLMKVYCAIIDHIRFKSELLGPRLSYEEKAQDFDFLRKVREMIRKRGFNEISRQELIIDLRQMLMAHAFHYKNS